MEIENRRNLLIKIVYIIIWKKMLEDNRQSEVAHGKQDIKGLRCLWVSFLDL